MALWQDWLGRAMAGKTLFIWALRSWGCTEVRASVGSRIPWEGDRSWGWGRVVPE